MQQLKERGNVEFKQGNHQVAYDLYSQAIEACDQEKEGDVNSIHLVYSNRAATLLALKRFEEALEDCEKVIGLDSNFLKGYLRKSLALKSLGRKKEALATAKLGMSVAKSEKSVGAPELTKLIQSLDGEGTFSKKSAAEAQELLKEYHNLSQDVEKLRFELETRQKLYRTSGATADYLDQVLKKQSTAKTYTPMGRMFLSEPVEDVLTKLKNKQSNTEREFNELVEKMKLKEDNLRTLSKEVEHVMRYQRTV